MCQFQLSKQERDLISLDLDIERCPVCRIRFYAPENSMKCHVCEGRNGPLSRLLTSWWVQVIFLGLSLLIGARAAFEFPSVLLVVLGGQLLGGNGLLSIIFGVVYLSQGKTHPNATKIKNWLQSTFMFFGLGWVLLILGALISASLYQL
jgi:hypothetical protein